MSILFCLALNLWTPSRIMIHLLRLGYSKLLAFRKQIHSFIDGIELNENVPVHAQCGRHESVPCLPRYQWQALNKCISMRLSVHVRLGSLADIQPESFSMLSPMERNRIVWRWKDFRVVQ
jgi:hypothetical protein